MVPDAVTSLLLGALLKTIADSIEARTEMVERSLRAPARGRRPAGARVGSDDLAAMQVGNFLL
jgi:hypothetical protein